MYSHCDLWKPIRSSREAKRIELLKRKSRPSATAVMPKQRPLMTLVRPLPLILPYKVCRRNSPVSNETLSSRSVNPKFIPRMLFKLRYAQGVNADRRTQEVLIQDRKINEGMLRNGGYDASKSRRSSRSLSCMTSGASFAESRFLDIIYRFAKSIDVLAIEGPLVWVGAKPIVGKFFVELKGQREYCSLPVVNFLQLDYIQHEPTQANVQAWEFRAKRTPLRWPCN